MQFLVEIPDSKFQELAGEGLITGEQTNCAVLRLILKDNQLEPTVIRQSFV